MLIYADANRILPPQMPEKDVKKHVDCVRMWDNYISLCLRLGTHLIHASLRDVADALQHGKGTLLCQQSVRVESAICHRCDLL